MVEGLTYIEDLSSIDCLQFLSLFSFKAHWLRHPHRGVEQW